MPKRIIFNHRFDDTDTPEMKWMQNQNSVYKVLNDAIGQIGIDYANDEIKPLDFANEIIDIIKKADDAPAKTKVINIVEDMKRNIHSSRLKEKILFYVWNLKAKVEGEAVLPRHDSKPYGFKTLDDALFFKDEVSRQIINAFGSLEGSVIKDPVRTRRAFVVSVGSKTNDRIIPIADSLVREKRYFRDALSIPNRVHLGDDIHVFIEWVTKLQNAPLDKIDKVLAEALKDPRIKKEEYPQYEKIAKILKQGGLKFDSQKKKW